MDDSENNLSKEQRVIQAKIHTKEVEVMDLTQLGPALLSIFGVLFIIFFFGTIGIIIGILMIVIAASWGSKRDRYRRKLMNEIKELEAELSE